MRAGTCRWDLGSRDPVLRSCGDFLSERELRDPCPNPRGKEEFGKLDILNEDEIKKKDSLRGKDT